MQPDSLIPNLTNPQSWNRFSYVRNNPVRFNDPTGHVCSDPDDPTPSCDGSGSYPTNTSGLGNSQVVISGEPLEDGLKPKKPKVYDRKCAYEDYYSCNLGLRRNSKSRTPDYVTLNLGGSIPGLGTVISGQLSITLDRFGNFYLGPGISFGPEAPLGFSASLSGGFIDTWSSSLVQGNPMAPGPGEQRSEEVLSGGYANGMICLGFCGGITNSLSNLDNVGFELLGIGVPQASVGGGKSYLIGDLKPNNDTGVPIW